jgi:hypothetical protein
MNTLLQKCVDELSKDQPDLSFIKGILTTVIEMNPSNVKVSEPTGVSVASAGGMVNRIQLPEEKKELTPAEQSVAEALAMTQGARPANTSVLEKNIILGS